MTARGRFVAIEGIDGAGKSRVIKDLQQHVGCDTYLTREPYLGHIIQQLKYIQRPDTKALLFAADRAVHLEQIIIPALNAGHLVITDRYVYSNLAYQMHDFNDEKAIDWLISIQPDPLPIPDLVLHLTIDPWEAVRRCANKGETENAERLAEIDENYCHVFSSGFMDKLPGVRPKIISIDASQPYPEVLGMVVQLLKDLRPMSINAREFAIS